MLAVSYTAFGEGIVFSGSLPRGGSSHQGTGEGSLRVSNEAEDIALLIDQYHPHFTIHLGHVYYVGDPPEVNENCLGIRNPSNNYDPVTWPLGSIGSFALNDNHEMYANGTRILSCSFRTSVYRRNRGPQDSKRAFFCLENRYWRIIAIDTGYNSLGFPFLEHVPVLNKLPFIGPTCKLPSELLKWIVNVVRPNDDQRGMIVLSHHQYYSEFEDKYHKPAKQLAEFLRKPVPLAVGPRTSACRL